LYLYDWLCTPLFQYESIPLHPSDLAALGTSNASSPFHFYKPGTPSPFTNSTCKVFPGDDYWPDESKWALLDRLTGGALIKTVPLAAPCYAGPDYDAERCAVVTSQWFVSDIQ